jgi:hypothetical protein
MPFFLFQNGGTEVRSMGDEMPSTAWAALGAMISGGQLMPDARKVEQVGQQPE